LRGFGFASQGITKLGLDRAGIVSSCDIRELGGSSY
jgi:hypothetical protein